MSFSIRLVCNGAVPATDPQNPSIVSPGAVPPSPPPEVLAAMRIAEQAYDRLAADGRTLQFALQPLTGRLSATLAGTDGSAIGDVSPSTVLGVAAGDRIA
jgi:hypothetical protein